MTGVLTTVRAREFWICWRRIIETWGVYSRENYSNQAWGER